MSIPLDRLYHYINSIAREIYNDVVLIYRFNPHGSKKLEDLIPETTYPLLDFRISPEIYCYDQEPLNFELYESANNVFWYDDFKQLLKQYSVEDPPNNLRIYTQSIYDVALLLHSEQRSSQVEKYKQTDLIPVYYWSHALISLDWFRYAQHVKQVKKVNTTFLIYNRAWSGTREYRLKFAEYLIHLELTEDCLMRVSPVDSSLEKHYDLHNFKNQAWRPTIVLEDHFPLSTATSHYSANFDLEDYESTAIEVVLETLFDDSRLHLTEKILRPIALGQPFILAGTHLSLEYLRSYGFKTFSSIWDESYDQEIDPQQRLRNIADLMLQISQWAPFVREQKLAEAQAIADYNKNLFFSNAFFTQITNELKENLTNGLTELENRNTSRKFIERRKKISQHQEIKQYLTTILTREDAVKLLKKARTYYNRPTS